MKIFGLYYSLKTNGHGYFNAVFFVVNPYFQTMGPCTLPSQPTDVRTEISVYCSFQHVRKNFEPHVSELVVVRFKGHSFYET